MTLTFERLRARAADERLRAPGRVGLRSARRDGFSLTEILIVVALIGIIALISTPAMLDFFKAMKVRTAAQRLVSHMRLARQVAVSRRNWVVFVVDGDTLPSSYRAWEDTNRDYMRQPDGADGMAGTDDDEPWVVRPVSELERDDVTIEDAYNDTTPGTADDQFSSSESVMSSGRLTLRFAPDGQVQRIDSSNTPVNGDTLIRIRVDGVTGRNRLDRWYASVNRPGKVQTDMIRNPSWQ